MSPSDPLSPLTLLSKPEDLIPCLDGFLPEIEIGCFEFLTARVFPRPGG
jgi:hypothetical protein